MNELYELYVSPKIGSNSEEDTADLFYRDIYAAPECGDPKPAENPAPAKESSPLGIVREARQQPQPHDAKSFKEVSESFDAAMKATRVDAAKLRRDGSLLNLNGKEGGQEMLQLANSIGSVRFQYAQMLSRYGKDTGNAAHAKKAKEVLEEIKQLDPITFSASPEVQGALLQLGRGQAIDAKTVTSDAFIDTSVRALDFPRYLTNPGREQQAIAVKQMSQAIINNPEYTKAAVTELKSCLRTGDARILQQIFDEAERLAAEALKQMKKK